MSTLTNKHIDEISEAVANIKKAALKTEQGATPDTTRDLAKGIVSDAEAIAILIRLFGYDS